MALPLTPCAKPRQMWSLRIQKSWESCSDEGFRASFVKLSVLRGSRFFACSCGPSVVNAFRARLPLNSIQMNNSHSGFTSAELRKLRSLKDPHGIQRFLDDQPYHLADTAW